MSFKQYDLKKDAELALGYIDGMTDRKYDYRRVVMLCAQ